MNAFEQLAHNQMGAASKARDRAADRRMSKLVVKSEADAPMVASPADKKMFEQAQQMKRYRAAVRQRRDDLLAGPYGANIRALEKLLNDLSGSSPIALVKYVQRAAWLRNAGDDTRHHVLSLVAEAIIRFRVRNGLSPFDDSLLDEPPTSFEQIRSILTGVGQPVEELA